MKFLIRFCCLLSAMALCLSIAMAQGEMKSDGTDEKNSSWFNAASRLIREMEYEASFQNRCEIPGSPGAYHMTNRAQNLRVYFFSNSVKVIRRTDAKPEWILEIGIVTDDDPSTITIRKNALTRKRKQVTETFSNDETGIHQDITIEKRSAADSTPVLTINLKSSLVPRKNGNALEFLKNNEPVLIYGDFRIVDKNKTPLPFDWQITDNAASLSINTLDAIYPLTAKVVIKTPSSEPDKILSIEQNFAGFGWSVATAGDINGDGYADVIAGAPYYDNGEQDEGAIFVWHGSSTGLGIVADWFGEGNQIGAKLG